MPAASPTTPLDRTMMLRCLALAQESARAGEYPYGALIARGDKVVAESINRVAHDGDVTRHSEVVAVSAAQKALGTTSLDDCTIYVGAEPCVFCCYAIRESRIGRVVYGMSSPVMGGHSRWNVLRDRKLSRMMPEVFARPPVVVAGFMAQEAQQALFAANPVVAGFLEARGLFIAGPRVAWYDGVLRLLRNHLFDWFGRRRRR